MSTKTVYLFDRVTSLYCGSYEAQESPEEPEEYILPIHCTEYPIPSLADGEKAKWNGTSWEVIPAPPPPPPPTPEQLAAIEAARAKAAKDAADALEAKEDVVVSLVAGFSMTKVDEYVELHFGNLTNPQKDFLKAVGKVCVIGARRL